MTQPSSFEAELDFLAPVAREVLPRIAEVLRTQRAALTTHEGLEGPGAFDAVHSMERAYADYTDLLGTRLWLGAERIDDTAEALRNIIDLYRKADGQ